ncbi:MAG: hypothetical protein ACKOA6_12135, partial [Actinomycetota bacterium]
MPVSSPDLVAGLGESWKPVRRAALERAGVAPFPSPDEEIWRYSRIAELDLSAYSPGSGEVVIDVPEGSVTVTRIRPEDSVGDADLVALFDDT